MTAYLAIRKHPNGGFAVVAADTDDLSIQDVDTKCHVQIGTLSLAQKTAHEESLAMGDVGYTALPECYTN